MGEARQCAKADDLAGWIVAYRKAANPPCEMMRRALEAFPGATGSDCAVAIILANRARAGG